MTINREKLIELLVDKTGFEKEQVEEQLSELISRIQKAAGEGKSFEIEGFGIFHIKDDELHFEPSGELETEVNHKYAGMEPIELVGSSREPDEEEEKEKEEKAEPEEAEPAAEPGDMVEENIAAPEEEDIWGLQESSSLQEELLKARAAEASQPQQEKPVEAEADPTEETDNREETAEAAEEEKAEAKEEAVEAAEEEVDEKKEIRGVDEEEKEEKKEEVEEEGVEEVAEKEKEEPETEEVDEFELFDISDDDPDLVEFKPEEKPAFESLISDEGEDDEAAGAKPKWEPAPELKTGSSGKKKDPIGTALIVFLIAIVAGVGTWFVYDLGLFSRLTDFVNEKMIGSEQGIDGQQPAQQDQDGAPPEETQPSQPTSESAVAQAGRSLEPIPGNEVAKSETAQTDQAIYGLRGNIIPDANDGYTIVVYSFRRETKARAVAGDLGREGYRATVSQALVDGTEYWRVGLGQFETVRDALGTASELREPFRNNFFVNRIK